MRRVLFNARSNNEAAATAVYQASKAAARSVTLQSVFKVSGVPMNRIGTLQRDLQRQLTEKHEDYQLPSEAQKLMDVNSWNASCVLLKAPRFEAAWK